MITTFGTESRSDTRCFVRCINGQFKLAKTVRFLVERAPPSLSITDVKQQVLRKVAVEFSYRLSSAKTPNALNTLETVVIPTRNDGLKIQFFSRLKNSKIRSGRGRLVSFIGLYNYIGCYMLRARRASCLLKLNQHG